MGVNAITTLCDKNVVICWRSCLTFNFQQFHNRAYRFCLSRRAIRDVLRAVVDRSDALPPSSQAVERTPLLPLNKTRNNSPERVSKAACDFEAILLRSLLEPLQKSFSKIAGEADSAGQEDYQYMATEAFASAIVSSGGLGIANMISKQLTRASSK
jgi:hypothetical protein